MKKQTATKQQSKVLPFSDTTSKKDEPNIDSTPELTLETMHQYLAIRYRGKSFNEAMGLMIQRVCQENPHLIPGA